MFKRNSSYFHNWLLSCRCVMFNNSISSKPKRGEQAAVRGALPVAMALVRIDHFVAQTVGADQKKNHCAKRPIVGV